MRSTTISTESIILSIFLFPSDTKSLFITELCFVASLNPTMPISNPLEETIWEGENNNFSFLSYKFADTNLIVVREVTSFRKSNPPLKSLEPTLITS